MHANDEWRLTMQMLNGCFTHDYNNNHDPRNGQFTSGKSSATIRAEADVNKICKINKNLYSCISSNIDSDEVVLTKERIRHIEEDHPGHYEIVKPYLSKALKAPDYIFEDKKHKNTGIILKRMDENSHAYVILRIKIASEPRNKANSIISTWKIGNERAGEYINSNRKKMLYKNPNIR